MARCHFSIGFVSSVLAAVALAACGPPPAAQVEGGDGQPKPADTSAEVVVPVPEPTTTAAVEAPPPADVKIPSRAATGAGPIDPCVAKLRDDAGGPDPAKATGAVDYHDALAAERTGRLDAARRGYLKLIQNYPNSTLIPAAYFAFGEMFAAEAALDPSKTAFAEQSYLEVLKYPSGPGSIHTVANYRLGLVLRASKGQQALSSLMKAAKADREAPTDGCVKEAAKAATEESTGVFAAVGQPDRCWAFYLSVTGDGARTAAACASVAEHFAAGKNGGDALKTLAASIELGAKAQADDAARAAYCKRVKATADAARSGGAASAALDKALPAACH